MMANFPWTLEVEGLGKLRCAKVQRTDSLGSKRR